MSAEVGTVKYKVELDDSGIDSEAKKAEGKIQSSFGAGAKNVAAGVGHAAAAGVKAAAGAVVAGTAAVGAFAKASLDAGMDFDSSMSQVAATMGKTVDEISDLRDFAQDMGSKTAFSATEAADALNYMALAGYDAETSMNMLPNVLNLAAAGGIELASASDMITDSQSALGLSLEETSTLVDQMAAASSKSNTSVEQLGEAILTVGGTAKAMKGGTTELSTVLGLLADNGVKGAEGGTALRNIMLSLQNPTDKAAQALKDLGVEAYDSQGNFRSMEDIFQDFNKALDGASDAKRSEALSTIFNKVDLKSVNALMDTNVERWKELSGAIDDSSGAAQKMADTQLDNLAGDVTLFQSALEGAKIAVSDGLTPQIRDFVKLGTDGLSQVTEGFKEGGIAGAMGVLGDVLSEAITMIVEMAPEMLEAGIELISALGQGLVDAAPDLAFAAFDMIEMLLNSMLEATSSEGPGAITEMLDWILGIFEENYVGLVDVGLQIIENLLNGMTEAIPMLLEWIPGIVEQLSAIIIENAPLLIEAAANLITTLATGLAEMLPELIPTVVEIVLTIVESLIDNIDQLVDAAIAITMALADGLIEALPILIEKAPEIIAKLVDALVENIPKLLEAALTIIVELAGALIKNLPKIVEAAYQIVTSIIKGIGDMLSKLPEIGKKIIEKVKDGIKKLNPLQWGKDLIDSFIKGITGGIQAVKDAVGKVAGAVKDFLGFSEPDEGPLSNFHTFAPDMIDLFAKGMEDNRDKLADASEDLAGDIAMGFTSDINYNMPDLAGYAKDLSASITGTGSSRIEVPVILDGREIARASAWYMGEQLAWEAR